MATEQPNTLLSNSLLFFQDVLSEGTIVGFWPQSGISGNNPLCSVLFNGIPVLNGDGSPNFNLSGQGFNFTFNSGTSGQGILPGFQRVEALIPLPLNTRVSNPPPNAAFPDLNGGYPQSPIVSFNTSMYPDADAVKVTLRFPAVYTVDPTNGDTNGFDITWAVDISLNNGPFLTIDQRSLSQISTSPKCTTPYYNTQIYPLPKTTPAQSYYEWKVRVRRVTQTILSMNTINEFYVDSIAVISTNSYRYPMTAVAGLEISAEQFSDIPVRAYELKGIQVLVPDGYTPTQYNQSQFNRLVALTSGDGNVGMHFQTSDQLSGIVPGTYVSGPGFLPNTIIEYTNDGGPGAIYFHCNPPPTITADPSTATFLTPYVGGAIYPATYPTIWNGSMNTRQWTDNPAWIFYDLVTNKRYGLGKYVRSDWIDKWTLYQIAQYCDEMVDDGDGGLEPRFTCNVVLSQALDAFTLLNNLVSVFRGMLYWANGSIFPVSADTNIGTPVYNVTNANIVNGAFNYSDTPRNTRSTICTVKWVDPTNQFRTSPVRVEDPVGITRFGFVEKQVTAFATTSRGQAIRAANWYLTVDQLLTETIQFQTDLGGLYLRPGDVFNVYDNFRNNQQQGGRIIEFSTGHDSVTIDRPVNLKAGLYYNLTTTIPSTALIGSGSITGSDQLSLIRNAQIESRKVTNSAGSSISVLTLDSGFSSGLFIGSPWVLNATGALVTPFDQALQYRCLTISEPQNGVVEVLGVKYSTGVSYIVNNNYSVVTNPVISGDTTTPLPPTGLVGIPVTGLLSDNTFFSYLNFAWSGSPSANAIYFKFSGQLGSNQPFLIAQPTTTGVTYTPKQNGAYTFSVCAVNSNGYESAFDRINLNVAATNPLGLNAGISGIYISNNFDQYYIRPSDTRYTGFVSTSPTFAWHITLDNNSNQVAESQFITGYRVRLLNITNESSIVSRNDFFISGTDNPSLTLQSQYLNTGTTIKALRSFTVSVDAMDEFGNIISGSRLAVSNPQLPIPINSGFIGYNGGFSYNVTPASQADTSGIYLWYNQTPSYTPTYDNVNFISSNFAGYVTTPYQTGSFYTWFALTDTFGFSGSVNSAGDYNAQIYGPISGNSNQVFNAFAVDITSQLTGAFGLLTGEITNLTTVIANTGSLLLQTVYGLSGSITGAGAISTALNANVNTAVVNSSGALSTQINAVAANLVTTGAINYALAGTVMSALATTGGALSQWITQLGAQTTGTNATVQIVAQAFATGSVNGLGGAAVAVWGFKLDANGKVVSMQATSSSFPGTYGTIVFGGANLQSDNFTMGSAGWQLTHDGNFEGNNGVFRGDFTGGAGSSLVAANSAGLTIGNPAGDRISMASTSTTHNLQTYNSSNQNTSEIGQINLGGAGGVAGYIALFDSAGILHTTFIGNGPGTVGGQLTVNGDDNGDPFDGLFVKNHAKVRFFSSSNPTYIMENNGIQIWGDGSHPVQISGGALLQFGSYNTTSDVPIVGYVTINDANGTSRKLAIIA